MSPRVAPDLSRAVEIVATRGCRLGEPIHLLAETGSTNDDAKSGAREGAPHGAVWIAETQARGRGRQGRSWISPPGENLLFSVLLRIGCAPARVPPISLVCGLAVRDAVASAIGDDERVLVKWPNDVVVRERVDDANPSPVAHAHPGAGVARLRKIAGVLVESAVAGSRIEHVVVGIGLNVHTRDFPDELSTRATSLALESSRPMDRAELLADILARLDHDVEHVAHRGLGLVHARLVARDALVGRDVESDFGSLKGVACGIDPDGRLLVRRADGVLTKAASGEVRLRFA